MLLANVAMYVCICCIYVYTYTTVLYRHIGFTRWLLVYLEILNMKVKDCRPWYNFHQITPPDSSAKYVYSIPNFFAIFNYGSAIRVCVHFLLTPCPNFISKYQVLYTLLYSAYCIPYRTYCIAQYNFFLHCIDIFADCEERNWR